jgi:NAD dependent epimerase/dehydratase family enzyme
MSWIALDDVVGGNPTALGPTELAGPVNTVAPTPVTNLEFAKTLGSVLSRSTVLRMPAFPARLVFGEMAQELLLSGQLALPTCLVASGFRFRYPELKETLRAILRR